MKLLVVDDRVELKTPRRRGQRGTVVDAGSADLGWVQVHMDKPDPRVRADEYVSPGVERLPTFWLRRLNLLEVLAEASAD
jgi:hypothetical protein